MGGLLVKFSVLMSVYQKENPDFLRKSLNSVLIEQSRKPDELVLVEDGPLTEELYQTIQDFKETFPEVKVLPLKENVGLGEALHRGVEACSYDWIARMDTDDIATPDRFQQQVDYIEQHPQLDVLGGNIIEFDTEPDQIVAEKQMPLSHEEIIKRLQRRNPFCHMTVFFKKSSVLKAGNYKSLPLVEDYYLWARMAAQGCRFANLNQVLVYARVGNGMHTRRSQTEQIASWKVVNTFLLSHGMLNRGQYYQNMLMIRAFVGTPIWIKAFIYKYLLRRK
ncbi:glycosyltransferase [Streptococcus sanguinis]|uniref:glycosyltransferase n=1 Tax=Streptococcus sanguinis TaxID=1305 RepID=UPI001565C574|nr:glycosyltransferase [Streptococcus sanguinis]